MTFNRDKEEARFISEIEKITEEYYPLIINNVKKYCERDLIYFYSKDNSFFDKYIEFCDALNLDISQRVFTVKTNLNSTFMRECPDLEFDVQYDSENKKWNVLNIKEETIYDFKTFRSTWVSMNILLNKINDDRFSQWVDDEIAFAEKFFKNLNFKTSYGGSFLENEKKEILVFSKTTGASINCQKIKDQDLAVFMLIEAHGNLSRKSFFLDAMEKINDLRNNQNSNIKAF